MHRTPARLLTYWSWLIVPMLAACQVMLHSCHAVAASCSTLPEEPIECVSNSATFGIYVKDGVTVSVVCACELVEQTRVEGYISASDCVLDPSLPEGFLFSLPCSTEAFTLTKASDWYSTDLPLLYAGDSRDLLRDQISLDQGCSGFPFKASRQRRCWEDRTGCWDWQQTNLLDYVSPGGKCQTIEKDYHSTELEFELVATTDTQVCVEAIWPSISCSDGFNTETQSVQSHPGGCSYTIRKACVTLPPGSYKCNTHCSNGCWGGSGTSRCALTSSPDILSGGDAPTVILVTETEGIPYTRVEGAPPEEFNSTGAAVLVKPCPGGEVCPLASSGCSCWQLPQREPVCDISGRGRCSYCMIAGSNLECFEVDTSSSWVEPTLTFNESLSLIIPNTGEVVQGDAGMPTEGILLICLCALAVLLLAVSVALIVWCCCRKKKARDKAREPQGGLSPLPPTQGVEETVASIPGSEDRVGKWGSMQL